MEFTAKEKLLLLRAIGAEMNYIDIAIKRVKDMDEKLRLDSEKIKAESLYYKISATIE